MQRARAKAAARLARLKSAKAAGDGIDTAREDKLQRGATRAFARVARLEARLALPVPRILTLTLTLNQQLDPNPTSTPSPTPHPSPSHQARLAALNQQLDALFLWLAAVETPRWRRLLVRRRRLGRRIGVFLPRSARKVEDFAQQLAVFVSAYLGTIVTAATRTAARLPSAAARAAVSIPG